MNPAIFIGTWWSLVPPLLAICLALITKEVYSSLILGIVAGVLMYTGFNPWQAFLAFYDIMKNSMNLNILIFDIMLGVVIVLMVESGGSRAYGEWAAKKVKTKKKALLATMGFARRQDLPQRHENGRNLGICHRPLLHGRRLQRRWYTKTGNPHSERSRKSFSGRRAV